jgi:hypothetical protein
MTSGSDVADQFVAATAARLSIGAAESVHRVAERREGSVNGPEWRLAQLLAERAVFVWGAEALRVAGQPVEAEALRNLRGITQATYLARLMEIEYCKLLLGGSELQICCTEAVAALDAGIGLRDVTDQNQLREPAQHAGQALAACFLGGAVTSIPDEVGGVLDLLAKEPLPVSLIAWE